MPFSFEDLEARAYERPQELIRAFFRQLDDFLKNCLEISDAKDEDQWRVHFTHDIGEHRDIFSKAYEEETLRAFDSAREAVGGTNPENLQAVGLTGDSLIAKLSVLEFYSKHLREGFKKAIKYIFDMINHILGSLKAAAGPATSLSVDMIQEFKDLIKTKIEFMNAW